MLPTDPRSPLKACASCCVFAVLTLRQRGRLASKVLIAASRNVGMLALRFSASGSRPSEMATRW